MFIIRLMLLQSKVACQELLGKRFIRINQTSLMILYSYIQSLLKRILHLFDMNY